MVYVTRFITILCPIFLSSFIFHRVQNAFTVYQNAVFINIINIYLFISLLVGNLKGQRITFVFLRVVSWKRMRDRHEHSKIESRFTVNDRPIENGIRRMPDAEKCVDVYVYIYVCGKLWREIEYLAGTNSWASGQRCWGIFSFILFYFFLFYYSTSFTSQNYPNS